MTGQHEPLWKPEVKSGAPEGQASPAPHVAPATMFPMSHQGMKRSHDNNIMAHRCHLPWRSQRHDKGVSNDGNGQITF